MLDKCDIQTGRCQPFKHPLRLKEGKGLGQNLEDQWKWLKHCLILRNFAHHWPNFDDPIRANRFADLRESSDSRESFQGSRTEPLLLRIALCGGGGVKIANHRFKAIRANRLHVMKISVSRRGGRNKGGRKQMRTNASKRRQTRTNASKRRGANASKREQTWANVDKRKQTLTPPFIAVFYTPLCNPLKIGFFLRIDSRESSRFALRIVGPSKWPNSRCIIPRE